METKMTGFRGVEASKLERLEVRAGGEDSARASPRVACAVPRIQRPMAPPTDMDLATTGGH